MLFLGFQLMAFCGKFFNSFFVWTELFRFRFMINPAQNKRAEELSSGVIYLYV